MRISTSVIAAALCFALGIDAVNAQEMTPPVYQSGASVIVKPGTGTLEYVLPVQTNIVASGACTTSCVYAAGDLFKKFRRSNSGSAMSDTLPASTASGMVNGARITIGNVDATASLTLTAGAGTSIATTTIGAGRTLPLVYDLANTAWRIDDNAAGAVIGPSGNNWNPGQITVSPNPVRTPYSGAAGFVAADGFGNTVLTGSSTTGGLNEVLAYGSQQGMPQKITAGGMASSPILSAIYNSTTGILSNTFAVAPFGASPDPSNIGGGVNITGMTPSSLNGGAAIVSFASAGTVVNVQMATGLGSLSPSGGAMNSNLAYFGASTTVVVPPISLQSIDITASTINCVIAGSAPCIQMDSSENSHFSMDTSQAVYGGTGSVILEKPTHVTPQDNVIGSSLNTIVFNSIVGGATTVALIDQDLSQMTSGGVIGQATTLVKEANGNGAQYGHRVTDPPTVSGTTPAYMFNVETWLVIHGVTVAGEQIGMTGANQGGLRDNIHTSFAYANGALPNYIYTYETGSIWNVACAAENSITNCVHLGTGTHGNIINLMDMAGATTGVVDQGTNNLYFYNGGAASSGCGTPVAQTLCFLGLTGVPGNSLLLSSASSQALLLGLGGTPTVALTIVGSTPSLVPAGGVTVNLGGPVNPWPQSYLTNVALGASTAHSVLIGENTSNIAFATIGTAGRFLRDNGAGADPSFVNLSTLTFGTHLTGTSYNGSAAITLATDATATNTASATMARDPAGQVAATTFTGALTGHASLDLPLTGGTMSGAINMNAQNINGIEFLVGQTGDNMIFQVPSGQSVVYTIGGTATFGANTSSFGPWANTVIASSATAAAPWSNAYSAVYTSVGTVPTGTTGSCSASSFTGGSTAGKFTAPTCAAGTIILSALPTAPNGYTCAAWDQTTPADALVQTANSVTSATFKATTVSGDAVVFKCEGW